MKSWWRIIFDGNRCGDADEAMSLARQGRYPMFSVNGKVYAVHNQKENALQYELFDLSMIEKEENR